MRTGRIQKMRDQSRPSSSRRSAVHWPCTMCGAFSFGDNEYLQSYYNRVGVSFAISLKANAGADMEVKYQIFVSSTFTDLQEERRKVIEMILNMGHIPIGMEAFQASDSTQWEYITHRIDECDYYVVIIAERYGSMQDGKSYTQMEYEYATEQSVPVAAFLLDDNARKSWPLDRVDTDRRTEVEGFRNVAQQKLTKYWNNPDDLSGKVALALHELFRDKPRTGWVRADAVPSKSVLDELAKLSDEKRALQATVEKLSDSNKIRVPPEVLWRIEKLNRETVESTVLMPGGETTTSLLSVLLSLDLTLASESDLSDIAEFFCDVLEYNFEENEVELVLTQFSLHGLVEGYWKLNGKVRIHRFKLTDFGKQFLMYAQIWTDMQIVVATQNVD
ncbi:DUF4062 domain-containing protein [Rhizobium leguminosarum]|uniref:DUF4062 domain-containing protein n=1 Tax=Rhizobium leguminosarum TaxID=384 RepID=UPI001C92AB24|nr:DUF4062 domain-containing protein [Rhizobium leguminosarum]MBY2909243.1 DUF4062 domain-containing protein [Rhizobium leguminosarum]MBY2949082.1 DUF4062 domain-containing protein [Rhizobium leguminosarum]